MSLHDHAVACLELTLITVAREQQHAASTLLDDHDDTDDLRHAELLEVDIAMWRFERQTLEALEYAAELGITDPD